MEIVGVGSPPPPARLPARWGTRRSARWSARWSACRNAPTPERFAKKIGPGEHRRNNNDRIQVPGPEPAPFKACGTRKHLFHRGYAYGVPRGKVAVEICGPLEHVGHVGDVADIPAPNPVWYGRVVVEEITHVGNGGDVPISNRAVDAPWVRDCAIKSGPCRHGARVWGRRF